MHLEWPSPCKINLLLNILGRRPDGFHELETVLHPVALYDTLRVETAEEGISLTCNDPLIPTGETNLVCRAASAFLQAAGIKTGLRFELEKRIPAAAGLGGGSGNAATTLLGLNQLWNQPLPAAELARLAATLGSDVPFFLLGGPALATGRGELVKPVGDLAAMRGVWALLIHPGFGVATPWAYRELANHPTALNGRPGRAARLVEALRNGTLAAAAADFYNSLEAPVLNKYPILRLYQEFCREHGALAAMMSGSGSTTFALAAGEAAACALRERFLARYGAACWTAVVPLQTAA